MKNRFLLLFSVAFSATAAAQQLHDGDILWPNSQAFPLFVDYWEPGSSFQVSGSGSVTPVEKDGVEFEDENFFISRVKMKPYFRNEATQVDESITEDIDKKLINWVPVNKADGGHTDALPNGVFDSEVFSNWSYVTHWGDWISPQGWVPAALSDVAHKHGVIVSGLASIPFGAITDGWSTSMTRLAEFDDDEARKEKMAKFLYYHGVDGLGYNSEFIYFPESNITKIQNVHKYLMAWMESHGHTKFENIWYDGTNDMGEVTFDRGLTEHNDGNFSGASLFWNYNWNGSSKIQNAINYARSMTPARSSLDLYAGFNMQGGEPKSNNWVLLGQYPISIGLWGAHNTNMLWAQRTANGSEPETAQDTYQKRNEQWFTNGERNPAKKMAIYDRGKYSPDDKWFGMSRYMSARSTLCWDLDDEPFITYFNLGNGKFLNWKGERQNNNEWYNLGVQDYMPTWRWWFTDKFMGKEAGDVPAAGLEAQFTWDDAYVGGSCLSISGTTDKEYLHLYKTRFALAAGDKITVRYKLLKGRADAKLVFSTEGAEKTPVEYTLFTSDTEADDEWVEYGFTLDDREEIAGRTIAMVALAFDNAEDMQLRIGEFSIVRKAAPTPNAPKIKKARVLRNNFDGVDAKIIFDMENDKAVDEPCYNLDVNTSLFKLYARVGDEVTLMGLTTSWAGICFSIPAGEAPEIQLGVSAVSTDMASESAIAWSEVLPTGTREICNDIVVSQSTIKPNEAFTVGYLDPMHEGADWELSNARTGEVVKSATDATGLEFPDGLAEIAPYNLKVTEKDGNERKFNWYIHITGEEAGALPKIYSVTLNGETSPATTAVGKSVNAGYTGRPSDGSVTRAIWADKKFIGGNMGATGLDLELMGSNGNCFSVAAWVRFTDTYDNSSFFSIENRLNPWPLNHWGWFSSNIAADGTIASYTLRTADSGGDDVVYTLADTKIAIGTWTHVAIVFDYQSNTKLRVLLYINGIKQETNWTIGNKNGTTDSYFSYPFVPYRPKKDDWFSFFGGRGSTPTPGNGQVDDLQIWDKAMTQEDVELSMALDRNNLPGNLLCYWDFERDNELSNNNTFRSIGTNKRATASNFALVAADGEGQAVQTPQPPIFDAGNPFLVGDGYRITTTPTWSGRRAVVSEGSGTGESGSAKVAYTRTGDYTLTLTLSNSYGSDSKEYPVITVDESTSVNETADDELRTYVVDDVLFVDLAGAGRYEVSLYNLSGALVQQKAETATAGQIMCIELNTNGMYIVRVAKDGRPVKAFKVLKK